MVYPDNIKALRDYIITGKGVTVTGNFKNFNYGKNM